MGRETGGYIVELDGGTFEKVPYNRVTGRAGEQEAAPVPVVPVEPERPTMAVPATEPPAQSAETPTKIPAAEPQVEMPTAELVRPRRLKVRKRQVSPYAAKAAALGDYVSIEDVILRDIAGGLRFVWGNRGNNRGLAEELGFTGNEAERRARIGILSNDGITPEQYAERLYFEHGAGNDGGIGNRWNLDDKDIKDTLLDILLRAPSPKKAYEEAMRLHEGETNPYESYTEEELAQMQRYEAARQEETEWAMADPDIIALWESTSPEQQAEIDNLFAESSSDFAENANFEPLAEQSGAAIDKFNQILSDENRTDTATDTARPAIRAIGENRGAAGGSQQRNTESGSGPDKGEPGAGPSAVRHDGGGLEPVRPDLTDEEQRVADETTAGIDDRLEELNTALRGKLSQYAAEKRKIGGAINEDKQGTLFGLPGPQAAGGDLFDVPRDLSGKNITDILEPLQREIDRAKADITALEASRQKAADDAVDALRAQQVIPLDTPAETDTGPALLLDGLENDIPLETAQRAFYMTSHVPERRGEAMVKEYADFVRGVYDAVLPKVETEQQRAAFTEAFAWFRDKTRRLYLDWLAAHGRVASSMITGPARFRVERNNKRMNVEQKRLEELLEWQRRAQKKVEAWVDAARTPEQKETVRLAETENEYRKYYVNAVRSFGDKIFDIRNNSLIKAAFVRDVQRLAKSDVEAAIRLVAAVNEAAVKYGGKPVLTARNRIHQELENMRSRRAVETSIGGVVFAPVQPIRHTKTGAELFAVKLTNRVDTDMFDVLKQRAKANEGYYSKFSRAFLFDRQEDAEAFRDEYSPKQEAGGTPVQQNDYLSGTEADGIGAAPQTHNDYEPDRPSDLQPDSGGVPVENGVDAAVIQDESGRNRRSGGQGADDAGAGGDGTLFGQPADGVAGGAGGVAGAGRVVGTRGNQPVQGQTPGDLRGNSRTADGGRSGGMRGHGTATDTAGKTNDGATAPGGGTGEHRTQQIGLFSDDKRTAQLRAGAVPVVTGNADNIAATLPYLLPEQQDDVLKAETQFFDASHDREETAYGKGMLFTNGTGTGKTFTGLGVINRFARRGETDILIVVPSQSKVTDWTEDARKLNLTVTPLSGVEDAGKGINITTYANFGQNTALYNRTFGLVVYDECHRLMEDKDGEQSSRTRQHFIITNKDTWHATQRILRTEEQYKRQQELLKELRELREQNRNTNDTRQKAGVEQQIEAKEAELQSLNQYIDAREKELQTEGEQAVRHTKVLFLSATPFKDHYNLRYAEGYLFKYPDIEKNGYNDPSAEEAFFLQYLGANYRMRYGRMEHHTEDGTLVAQQEVAFAELLKERGVMSGRMIVSDMDYSRDFPTVTGFNAGTFNNALNSVFDHEAPFGELREAFSKVFHDYNYSTKLFEILKASAAAERIRQHLALGRKVVVFHRRMQGGVQPPFALALNRAMTQAKGKKSQEERSKLLRQISGFKRKYADLLDYERKLDYRAVPAQLKETFGGRVRLFNGLVTAGERNRAVRQFNSDTSGVDMLVIQEESGKEGISLHDTTGAHQRVLMNLTLPNSSITALQIEGRIYRIGNRTDAIFEYPLLGLDSEIYHFGSNINKRLSTTENLAMGALARDLINSFKNGVEESGEIDLYTQGKGGKAIDRSASAATTASGYQKAILDYYNILRKTSSNKSREGIDYYATPEPLGFKMVEWADGKNGDAYLEPSAGHGAIARYVPATGQLTAIEPSTELYSKLNLRAGGGTKKVLQGTFEDFALVNKYDVVVMNPPYGSGGKTAAEHIAKAYRHLNDGGRIVAIVPDGSAMAKRLEALLYGEKSSPAMTLRAEVKLPGFTFERAATNVNTKVIIIDRIEGQSYIPSMRQYDLSDSKDIKEFFTRLEELNMPGRILPVKEEETEGDGDSVRFRGKTESNGLPEPTDRTEVEVAAVRLAGALHTPVEVVRDIEAISDADAGRQKRKRAAKGWYEAETGKAVLVLPNVESAADAEATVLHEVVGHMGMRAVLGKRFDAFLDRVYKDADGSLQEPIDRMAGEEQHRWAEAGQELHPATEARRIATEEYLAELAEGNTTPGRFARIIGAVRRWFREVLGVPLRVNDRDIAYMLWLSRHRLSSARTTADAVRETAAGRRVRAALYGSEPVRYRIIMDDATPENIERYSVQEWLKTHRLPGVEFGEHWDDFARMVYDHATDLGRSVIHELYGDVPLAATKRYLALRDLREVTDRAGYKRIIGELIKVLPRERRQEIVASQKKHLEFIFSDEYKSPLRRRTSKDEKPLPENFKYAAEYVEELLKKRKQQKAIVPAGEIEPTIIYDKRNKKHLLENILFDSTMPVRKLQEEITRRGGKIDDITNVYEHLNHYSSVTKVALQKYTDDYINPMLERISGLAKLTGADAEAVADYLSAESSLERDLSGVPALSPDPKSDWNREVAEAIIKAFRDVAGRKRVEAVERDGIGGIPAEERAELPAGLLEKVTRDGLASLDAAELSELREAPVSALWRAVNAANDHVLDMLIEDGMMAQETRRLVKGHNWKYYVPLRSYDYSFRDEKGNIAKFDATELYDFIDARHTSGRLRQVVQEAEGRFTKPFNPVVQMVNIGIGAVISAKTNRMRQSALRLVQNTKGGGDLFRVNRAWMAKAVGNRWVMTTIDPSVEDIELSKEARKKIARLDKELQQAKKAHDEQGIAILESQIDEAERYNIVREYRATDDGGETFGHEAGVSQTLQRQRCVECYVNGIKYIVTFADPAVSNAINGYHRLSIPQWVDNTVGNATRWLSRAFTSRNPAFVTVNFLRDVQHAALVHALDRGGDLRGFVRNVAPGMAAITREVRGKARPLTVAELRGADMLTNEGRQRLIGLFGAARVYDTLYDYFRENGGETGFVHGKSVEEAERDVRRYVAFRTGTVGNLLQKTKKSERPAVALSYVARKSGATAVAEAFDRASRVAENTSRFATFVASLEQGKTMLRAVSDAKNVTVNFNRRGVATRALGMFYVFFNASMQGAAQVGRVAWRNRQRFAGAVAGMVSAGFLESLLLDFFLAGQGDDRDYISEYDRRNNLIIPLLGTRGFLKLPLPQGFRAFHGLGVLLHDAYVGKITAEECGRSMLGALYEDFSPVASPSSGGDLLRVVVPTAATPFYDIAVGRDAFGYPVGKRSFDDAPDYPLSEMGLRNVNRAILVFCRGLNALGGGDRDTPAGLRENGEIDPVLRGLFEWNPSHVEHVLTYYGGGMGKFAKDVVHTTQSLVDTDAEMNSYDLPIVNRLFGTAREENPASRYYALRERMNNLSAVQKRKGETDGPDAERVQLFREYDRIVRRIRKVLSGTNPGAAEYERLQEELNEAMKEYLTKDGQLYD